MKTFEKKELKKKSDNISEWYTDVVLKAELADYAPVKGTMVIRPYGYAIWEHVQQILDNMFKSIGVENAYFPMFIPHSLLEKEKAHVEGFSPELAIVTHGGGEKLKDPLVVRPTSETIMYEMYGKWIHSWRDLPVLINQWNNIIRWEKRTYLFLRTMEFLWQEGHTAHATEKEAVDMQLQALDWYQKTYEDYYAMPVITGKKSESEKFAGAKTTFCVEALMPDGKALQACTSHNLGQNFSKVFDIKFQSKEGTQEFVWQTSWGFSTRSLGGLFLTHGDDNGIVMPPKLAPIQIIIIPIFRKDSDEEKLLNYCKQLEAQLKNAGIRVKVDASDVQSAGRKFNAWEVKGVPIRFEIGQQELDGKKITAARRDTSEKIAFSSMEMESTVKHLLEDIQKSLFARAQKFLVENTHTVDSYDQFKEIMNTTRGFLKAFWCEDVLCESKIKEETKATTRCLPLDSKEEIGKCVYCGKDAKYRWYFAQAY